MSQYGYTQLSRTTPKAKVKHTCIWCAEIILPGEKYERTVGNYRGDLQTSKFHPECADACERDAADWGYDYEFTPYSNPRGKCEYDED